MLDSKSVSRTVYLIPNLLTVSSITVSLVPPEQLQPLVPGAHSSSSRWATRVLGHIKPETKVSRSSSHVVGPGVLGVHNPE